MGTVEQQGRIGLWKLNDKNRVISWAIGWTGPLYRWVSDRQTLGDRIPVEMTWGSRVKGREWYLLCSDGVFCTTAGHIAGCEPQGWHGPCSPVNPQFVQWPKAGSKEVSNLNQKQNLIGIIKKRGGSRQCISRVDNRKLMTRALHIMLSVKSCQM